MVLIMSRNLINGHVGDTHNQMLQVLLKISKLFLIFGAVSHHISGTFSPSNRRHPNWADRPDVYMKRIFYLSTIENIKLQKE